MTDSKRPDAAPPPSDAAQPTDCVDCGRHYGNEYGFPDLDLPNDVWAAISPTGNGGGLLCPSCICKRLADRGFEDVPAVFRSGPFCVLDAAPVAWRYKPKRMKHWNFTRTKPLVGKHPEEWEIQPLFAHPEDAPEGPWVVDEEGDDGYWSVRDPDNWDASAIVVETKKQAIAVRDVLNRQGDET